MAVGQFTIVSGTYTSEQDIIDQLDDFLTLNLRWQRLDILTDTGSDNNRVYFSSGEIPGKYFPIYAQFQGVSDDVFFSGYTAWDAVGNTGNDLLFNSSESRIQAPGQFEMVFIGNQDVVYVIVFTTVGYLGGIGYWDTFYTPEQDPYPLYVLGDFSSLDSFIDTFRVRSYVNNPEGFSAHFYLATQ